MSAERDKEELAKIQQLADEIYYSADVCEPGKIYELDRLASQFGYMDFDRRMMRTYFEKSRSYKRLDKRDEAWRNVRSHAHNVGDLAAKGQHC